MAARHLLKAAIFPGSDKQPRTKLAIRDAKYVRHVPILASVRTVVVNLKRATSPFQMARHRELRNALYSRWTVSWSGAFRSFATFYWGK